MEDTDEGGVARSRIGEAFDRVEAGAKAESAAQRREIGEWFAVVRTVEIDEIFRQRQSLAYFPYGDPLFRGLEGAAADDDADTKGSNHRCGESEDIGVVRFSVEGIAELEAVFHRGFARHRVEHVERRAKLFERFRFEAPTQQKGRGLLRRRASVEHLLHGVAHLVVCQVTVVFRPRPDTFDVFDEVPAHDPRIISRRIASSRSIRCSVVGWVLNRLAKLISFPVKGLTMNIWAVSGVASGSMPWRL